MKIERSLFPIVACMHTYTHRQWHNRLESARKQSIFIRVELSGFGLVFMLVFVEKSFVRCRKKNMTILIGCGLVKTKLQTTRSSYAKLPRLNFKPPNDSVKIMRTQFIRRLFRLYSVFVFVSIAIDKKKDYR